MADRMEKAKDYINKYQEDFLSKNPLSPFAIYIMSKEELICPNSLFFQNIEGLYNPLWNDMEIQLFRQLVTTFTEAT